MCRKELGGAAKYRDGRRPSCCGELREAVIVHFADGGLSFSCWETRVLDKKRRGRPLMAFDPTINFGNGREAHISFLSVKGSVQRIQQWCSGEGIEWPYLEES
jgi:hypothetical protein